MAQETPNTETLEFRTEVQQLLNILAHSLYTEREIFLRELISNASDALHRIQFELLTDRAGVDPDAPLEIRIDWDEDARTLTVTDTGIGMTREELIENLGTIAHSGALAFMQRMAEGQRPADIIGQFGVGFYSVFMVADEVTVTTRAYRPDAEAWRWVSRGDSRFTLAPSDKTSRGTTIELKLKEDAAEFTSRWRLERIVKKHSDFVSFPVYVKDTVANQQTALWRKPLGEVTEEEYADFYRQLSLDPAEPLLHIHVVTDAPVDLRSILYVPRKLDRGVLNMRADYGVKLYSKKVLIQEFSKDLLPEHLRFVEGVVDSEDIPLNISRETVQSNRLMRQIQKVLTGRVLKALRELADERPEEYMGFWNEFGVFFKQGIASQGGENADLLPLLRFQSSKSDGKPASLAEYVGRMAEGQSDIYYILGSDLASVAGSPHLDACRARDLEVFYLADPFDGFMMQGLREFEGKPFRNVDDPSLELPGTPRETPPAEAAITGAELAGLFARCKLVLGDRITEVRESQALVDSPARLVSANAGFDRDLQRVRRLLEQDYKIPPKILELNGRHRLVRNLAGLVAAQPAAAMIDPAIELLFDNLLLVEGLHPNPAGMAPRIQALLEQATK